MKQVALIIIFTVLASASIRDIEKAFEKKVKEEILGSSVIAELMDSMKGDVPIHVVRAFNHFKKAFGRVYEGEEHEYRLGVFHDNLNFITDFNMKELGVSDLRLGINEFSDMTHEEFKMQYVGGFIKRPESALNVVELDASNLADSVDWRTKGAVTPVKNQEQCGSCWAFSAVAAMEGAYFQKNGQLKSFSEQQLVDCSKKEGNHGCQGGLMDYAFKYAETNKMELEADYKYTGKNGACKYEAAKGVFNTVSFSDVKKDSTDQLAAASMAQVVSVAIEADKRVFQHYKSGVIDSRQCGTKLDHGVTVVGYNDQAWIVKNSWGPSWGDKGYVQIAKGASEREGVCGILEQPSYPKL